MNGAKSEPVLLLLLLFYSNRVARKVAYYAWTGSPPTARAQKRFPYKWQKRSRAAQTVLQPDSLPHLLYGNLGLFPHANCRSIPQKSMSDLWDFCDTHLNWYWKCSRLFPLLQSVQAVLKWYSTFFIKVITGLKMDIWEEYAAATESTMREGREREHKSFPDREKRSSTRLIKKGLSE